MKRNSFTLIELLVAMAVLAIFLLALMQFFTSTQNLMSYSNDRAGVMEKNRAAMALIAADVQAVYYDQSDKKLFFAPPLGTIEPDSKEKVHFRMAVMLPEPPADSISRVGIVGYEYDPEAMTLTRFVLGDGRGKTLNGNSDFKLFQANTNDSVVFNITQQENPLTSIDRIEVMNNVLEFKVTCYVYDSTYAGGRRKLDVEYDFSTGSGDEFYAPFLDDSPKARIPDMVEISYTLLDDYTMNQILTILGKTPDAPEFKKSEITSDIKDRFVKPKQKTFRRMITLDKAQN